MPKEKNYNIIDFGTWLRDFGYGKIFRMWNRTEIDQEGLVAGTCVSIINAIEVPNDILLELVCDPWEESAKKNRIYEPLSKIQLAYFEKDQEEFEG